jgi:tRNA dimethylallyltransferase
MTKKSTHRQIPRYARNDNGRVQDGRKLLVVVGPTASGKSALAVKLAKRFNGEIISADSRQVYKGFDIGTGKITKKEMAGIPHHLLDVASPRRVFTVADFKRLAEKKIKEISRRGKLPIICGGTGLYIRFVTDDVVLPEVPPDKKLRARLAKKTAAELAIMLKKIDPERFKTIDTKNPVRLIRAIEIVKALGKVPPAKPVGHSNYDLKIIGIKIDKNKLGWNIRKRLIQRLNHGMVAEAEELHRNGLSWKRMEELGLEYRYLAKFLQGKLSKARMTEELYKDIVQYAKRQMTWFRKDQRIKWVKGEKEAVFDVRKFLS